MRRFLFACLGLVAVISGFAAEAAAPRAATPEEIALLKQAMTNSKQDTEHWAYTEATSIQGKKGTMLQEETIVRFDPSKPYEEQFTPIKVEGRAPREKDFKRYRKQGVERHKALEGKLAEPEAKEARFVINDKSASLDVEHALVLADDAERVSFEIPLVAKRRELPVEKFQIMARVNKQSRLLEQAALRVRAAFRMGLVGKIKEGEARMDFTVIDPEFAPMITHMYGDFGASFMFIPLKGTFTNQRTEWKRVKAFDERFNVKMAPLQMLGF